MAALAIFSPVPSVNLAISSDEAAMSFNTATGDTPSCLANEAVCLANWLAASTDNPVTWDKVPTNFAPSVLLSPKATEVSKTDLDKFIDSSKPNPKLVVN